MIGKYKIIALCTCRIQDEESHNFIAMLNEKLVKIGCRLFIYNTCWVTPAGQENSDPQLSIFQLLDQSFIDAVILQADRFYNYAVCENIVKRALSRGVPVVSLGLEFEYCLNIQYNHQKGFKEIIEHLIKDHEIRDFHMIAGLKDNKYSDERIEVFKNVMKDYSIPFNDSMISYGDFWPEPAKAIAQKMVDEKRLPRAFVCANDKMAIAVTEVLMQNGINVPNDVAVTGFDCIDSIYSSEPTITSAFISPKISAQVIFETVREAILYGRKEGIISLGSVMVVNESCGCKSQEKINLTPYLNEQVSRFCYYQDEDMIYAELGSKMHTCSSLEEIVDILRNTHLYESTGILLKKEFLDIDKDPKKSYSDGFSDDLFMLYYSDQAKEGHFQSKDVTLGYFLPKIEKYLDEGRSLIFSTLHYQGVPLGYVCFFFEKHRISDYYRVPQIITTTNNGLGGYRNAMHHEYLMAEIEKLYRRDALTGLYNRRGFILEYKEFLKNYDGDLTVIMCDLDHLKTINDNYGHEEGDIAIQKVAESLSTCYPDAILTRFGGDEMLGVIKGLIESKQVIKKINDFLDDYNNKSNKPYITSASIGVYHTHSIEKLSLEELIKYSDDEMYIYKKKRK